MLRAGGPLHEALGLPHRLFFHGRPVAQDQTRQRNPGTAFDVPLPAPLVIDARRQDGYRPTEWNRCQVELRGAAPEGHAQR
jgi:hypothetical protein